MRISIVMPAYNEEAAIAQTIRRCFEILCEIPGEHEVVVTDDGSKDKTQEILGNLKREFASLKVVTHSPNQGYGAALADAIQNSTGDVVVSIDSDGQFDIGELPSLLNVFTDDILTGFRIAKQDSKLKVFADRIMNLIIRILFHAPYRDTNCAFKLYRGDLIRSLNLEARSFQLPTEIILKSAAFKLRIQEHPIHHYPRTLGQSVLAPFKTAFQMLIFLGYLRIKIALYRSKIIRGL